MEFERHNAERATIIDNSRCRNPWGKVKSYVCTVRGGAQGTAYGGLLPYPRACRLIAVGRSHCRTSPFL